VIHKASHSSQEKKTFLLKHPPHTPLIFCAILLHSPKSSRNHSSFSVSQHHLEEASPTTKIYRAMKPYSVRCMPLLIQWLFMLLLIITKVESSNKLSPKPKETKKSLTLNCLLSSADLIFLSHYPIVNVNGKGLCH
jgi:hypothetical protein